MFLLFNITGMVVGLGWWANSLGANMFGFFVVMTFLTIAAIMEEDD